MPLHDTRHSTAPDAWSTRRCVYRSCRPPLVIFVPQYPSHCPCDTSQRPLPCTAKPLSHAACPIPLAVFLPRSPFSRHVRRRHRERESKRAHELSCTPRLQIAMAFKKSCRRSFYPIAIRHEELHRSATTDDGGNQRRTDLGQMRHEVHAHLVNRRLQLSWPCPCIPRDAGRNAPGPRPGRPGALSVTCGWARVGEMADRHRPTEHSVWVKRVEERRAERYTS